MSGRLAVFREIHYAEHLLPNFAPRAILSFVTHDDEEIVFDLSCLFPRPRSRVV